MGRYAAQRALQAIPTLLIMSFVVFVLVRMAPGDPAELKMGREASLPENKPRLEALRREMGLDKPIPVQYVLWLRDSATGNFGESVRSGQPAMDLVASKLPASLELLAGASLLALLIAFPGGLLAAVHRGSPLDRLVMGFSAAGLAVPGFWLGLTLILLFSVSLKVLPPGGYMPLQEEPVENLKRLVMPAFVLGVYLSATLMRFLRADMIEVLAADYIRTARAKGLRERGVIVTHALKNALIPVVTIAGIEIGHLVGGAVIVEQVFGWSGMGWLTVQAIFDRDYPVVQASVLLIGTSLIVTSLLVDLAYAFLNPKMRAQLGG
ncbi:MAG: ABC transporter permease [Thermomicrobiales bacterium]